MRGCSLTDGRIVSFPPCQEVTLMRVLHVPYPRLGGRFHLHTAQVASFTVHQHPYASHTQLTENQHRQTTHRHTSPPPQPQTSVHRIHIDPPAPPPLCRANQSTVPTSAIYTHETHSVTHVYLNTGACHHPPHKKPPRRTDTLVSARIDRLLEKPLHERRNECIDVGCRLANAASLSLTI